MRIGLMGGTFDPIHYGHLILAEQAWEQFDLEKVLFVTSADPPHKQGRLITDAETRHSMVQLAVEGNEHFECSRMELERDGPSYTVDTIEQILREYGADTYVYLLVGADEAKNFMTWREPYRIRDLATIVVANRPGWPVSEALNALPGDFAESIAPLEMPGVDIAATDLRERVRSDRSVKYLVPDKVESLIWEKGLYRGLV